MILNAHSTVGSDFEGSEAVISSAQWPWSKRFERPVTPEQPIRAPSASEDAVSSDLSTGAMFSNVCIRGLASSLLSGEGWVCAAKTQEGGVKCILYAHDSCKGTELWVVARTILNYTPPGAMTTGFLGVP